MLLIDQFLNTDSDNTFFTITAIIGHYDGFITARPYLIFQDDEVF